MDGHKVLTPSDISVGPRVSRAAMRVTVPSEASRHPRLGTSSGCLLLFADEIFWMRYLRSQVALGAQLFLAGPAAAGGDRRVAAARRL